MLGGYATLIRPRILRWGATDEETTERLPGDEVVAQPRYQTTHAVTIHTGVAGAARKERAERAAAT